MRKKKTHSGNDKELYFENNKHLFKEYLHKIIQVIDEKLESENSNSGLKDLDSIISDFKKTPARIREENQRNSITKGLDRLNLNDDDIVIISDADEIINPDIILNYKTHNFDMLALEQDLYFYNLNYKYPKIWTFPKVVKYKLLKELTPEDIRLSTNGIRVPNGGWHFTYFFGVQAIADKIKNFSHQEFNNDFYTNEEYIENCIKDGKYIFSDVKLEFIDIENNKNLPKNYDIILSPTKYLNIILFKINNLEIITDENNIKSLKIYYEYFGDKEIDIRISIIDTIFKTVETYYNTSVIKGVDYWVILYPSNVHPFCNTHLTMGVDITITNQESNEIIHKETIPFIITDIKKRSINSKYSYSVPNFWIIGDSHVGNIFNNIDSNKLLCDNFVINYISHFLLTISKFIKLDWRNFLKTIPIKDGDVLAFLLGEIDLRISIIWKLNHINDNEIRLKNMENILNNILIKYIKIISEIKELYPKCKIVILAPNPPLRDNFENKELIGGSEEERLFLWNKFNSFFNSNDYWNCMEKYTDEDGYMKTESLRFKYDHHISDGELFINSLKEKIRKL